MRRSLHKTARETPSRTAYVARIPAPSMHVTSGPGVPTGGSLSHAQRLRAPSSADERFDILLRELDRRRFQESVSRKCRPKIQVIFGHPLIFSECAPRRKDAKNLREGDGGCGGDVGNAPRTVLRKKKPPPRRERGGGGDGNRKLFHERSAGRFLSSDQVSRAGCKRSFAVVPSSPSPDKVSRLSYEFPFASDRWVLSAMTNGKPSHPPMWTKPAKARLQHG